MTAPSDGALAMETNRLIDKKANHSDTEKMPLLGSCRLAVAVFGFLTLCTSFSSQASMTSAMVCMIKEDINDNNNNNNNNSVTSNFQQSNFTEAVTSLGNGNETSTEIESWKFSWDSQTQGFVVSSFFFGYFISQIPSGIIVTKFGPKRSITVGMIANGILHLLSIPTARWSLPALYFVRFVVGLTCGFLFPGTYALIVNWSPRHEASFMLALAGIGVQLGNSLIFLISLIGCELPFQGGWPFIFYVLGCLQIVVGLVTVLCITDFPSSNRFICQNEANYIAKHSVHDDNKVSIPYGKILRSLPVWAFLIGQFAMEYMFYTIVTQGPIFMRDILKLPPWKINVISSTPYLISMPFGLLAGRMSDELVTRGILSTTSVRKWNETVCKLLTGITLSVLPFLPVHDFVGALLLVIVGAIGLQYVYIGCVACPNDLSPAHAGFMAGLSQAVSIWVSFVIPIVTAELTKEKTREGWRIMFFIAVGLEVFCLTIFLLFGSGKLQPWATADSEKVPIRIKTDKDDYNTPRMHPLYMSTSSTPAVADS